VLINPFYVHAHFFLGRIAIEEGNIVAAQLSFMTNLGLDPENINAQSSAINLSNIALTKDDILAKVNMRKQTDDDNFELQQEIVLARLHWIRNTNLIQRLKIR